MAAGEGTRAKVDHHAVESKPLTLVYGQCPSQFKRILHETAEFFFDYFLIFFVEAVADVAPAFAFNHVYVAVVELNPYFVGQSFYHLAQCAVDPASVDIVFNENHLSTGLQPEFKVGWIAAFRKFAGDLAFVD